MPVPHKYGDRVSEIMPGKLRLDEARQVEEGHKPPPHLQSPPTHPRLYRAPQSPLPWDWRQRGPPLLQR